MKQKLHAPSYNLAVKMGIVRREAVTFSNFYRDFWLPELGDNRWNILASLRLWLEYHAPSEWE